MHQFKRRDSKALVIMDFQPVVPYKTSSLKLRKMLTRKYDFSAKEIDPLLLHLTNSHQIKQTTKNKITFLHGLPDWDKIIEDSYEVLTK